jgi:hypothetical protein
MRRGVAQRTIWTAAGAVLVLVMLAPQPSAARGSLPNPLTFATQILSQMMSLQTLFQHPMNSATLPGVTQWEHHEHRFGPEQLRQGIWYPASLDRHTIR